MGIFFGRICFFCSLLFSWCLFKTFWEVISIFFFIEFFLKVLSFFDKFYHFFLILMSLFSHFEFWS